MIGHDNGVMAMIKVSSKVDEASWRALQALAKETHQSISGLLTEAVQAYLRNRAVRPVVMVHLEASINDNAELGHLLAR
jgi:predicted transcriptional regulator